MRTPVISLWQPWAQWVLLGWKTIETRTHPRFASLEGKRIGIHVAQKWDPEWRSLAEQWLTPKQIEATEGFLRMGSFIGATAFVERHRKLLGQDGYSALIDCGSTQRWGLDLTHLETIEAIPCKGKQGIWYFDLPQVAA